MTYSLRALALSRKFFLISLNFLFIWGCSSREESNSISLSSSHPDLEIEIVRKIEINVPDSINYGFLFWRAYEDGDSLKIIGLSGKRLHTFDANKGKLLWSAPLAQDGINRVGYISQFEYHSDDSIFLFSKGDYRVYLINNRGTLIDEFDVNKSLGSIEKATSIECFMVHGDRMVFYPETQQLLLRTFPPYDLTKDVRMYQSPYKILYNINSREVDEFFGVYPKNFLDPSEYYSNDYQVSYLKNEDRHLQTFRRSHFIFEIDLSQNTVINRFPAKSKYLDMSFDLIPRNAEFDDIRRHYSEAPTYTNITYNKTFKQYYRLVDHKADEQQLRRSSIMVLDTNMNVLGEALLPPATYFIRSAQQLKAGLITYRYDGTEGLLVFDIIRVKTGI